MASKVTDFTLCFLCNKHLSVSRCLPCQDCFCLQCLENYADGKDKVSGDVLECPLCGDKFTIPDCGLVSLPQNAFIQHLLIQSELATDINCDICTQSATVYCLECQQNMCEQCHICHVKFTATKQHRVITKVGNNDRYDIHVDRCDKHHDKQTEMYCRDCHSAICLACFYDKHNTHTCTNIHSVAKELHEEIHSKIADMDHLVTETRYEEKELQKEYRGVLDQIAETELVVLRTREELSMCIENDVKGLLDDLKYLRENITREFEEIQDEIVRRRNKMEHLSQYSAAVLAEGSSVVITSVASELRQQADKLCQQHCRKHVKRGYRPTVEVNFESLGLAMQHSKRQINLLGRITATIARLVTDSEQSSSQPPADVDHSRPAQNDNNNYLQTSDAPVFHFNGVATLGNCDQVLQHTARSGKRRDKCDGSTAAAKPKNVPRPLRNLVRKSTGEPAASQSSSAMFSLRGLLSTLDLSTVQTSATTLSTQFTDDEETDSETEFLHSSSCDETNDQLTVGITLAGTTGQDNCVVVAAAENVEQKPSNDTHNISASTANKIKLQDCGNDSEVDVIRFAHPGKLYELKRGTWRAKGIGELKLLRCRETGQLLMQMSDIQTEKMILNNLLTGDVKLVPMPDADDREWSWINTVDEFEYKMFSLRFTSKEVANNFKQTFDSFIQLFIAAKITEHSEQSAAASQSEN